jgi:hypothetical protein
MILGWLVVAGFLTADNVRAVERLDFARQIRPILSDKCFVCHGPDKKNRKAGLRLDLRESAIVEKSGVTPIVPGNAAASEVVRRIQAVDVDDVMPPPETKNPLTAVERDLLKRWIEEGAEYRGHWAFEPIRKPVVPKVNAPVRTPIDAFLLRELESSGFGFSPDATPERLIRRLAFDLTGLPPTEGEIDGFLAERSEESYARLVESYLARESHGERMASEWLDVARYSDTYGYQVDRDRRVWPYRDWVIAAFNRNMPHDRFISEQVAGDLLPNPTKDQILATAFNRLHSQKVEGGSVPEEFRTEYVSDRLHTFGTAFLALTFECARCHDHKYDPLLQEEYYGLASFFDNIDEAGLYSFFTPSVPTPAMMLTDEKQDQAIAEARARVAAAERALADAIEAERNRSAPAQAEIPGLLGWFDFEGKDGAANRVDPADESAPLGRNTLVSGRDGSALQLTGDDEVRLGFGNFTRHDPFTIALWLKAPTSFERAVVFHRSRAWTDAASRGYELLIEDGRLSAALIHFWPGNAIRVQAVDPLPVGEWVHVAMTYDGSSRADGLRLHVNGVEVAKSSVRDGLTKNITGGGNDVITIGARFRDRGFEAGLVDDFKVFDRELTALEVRDLRHPGSLAKALGGSSAGLTDHVARTCGPRVAKAARQLRERRGELGKLLDATEEIMVMRETEERPTFYLQRGAYDAPSHPVPSMTPAFLPAFPKDAPKNRLGLARWLTDSANPLTSRVVVNRYWQMFFGHGLVRTANDFGNQGEPPTHPELLDWLASDFVENGWDLKRLMTQIVTSTAYRQDSRGPAELLARDPENRLLGRAPSHRLPAEMIRDNALFLSGLMVEHIGGESVKPYEVAEAYNPSVPDKGDGLYRRSLYTYWKRTAPAPAMMALDAAWRDVCSVKRETTATPLQAFVFMNDPQFVEAARVLVERILTETGGDIGESLRRVFRRLTSRYPSEAEMTVLRRMHQEQRARFEDRPEAVKAFLGTGNQKAKVNSATNAAMSVVVIGLLSHDECVMKR